MDVPRTAYVLAESVLEQPIGPAEAGAADLARAFFAAFGPATATDFVYWSGLPGPQAAAALRDAGLLAAKAGRQEILDVGEPLDTTARKAFVLPEFDNLLFCRKNDPGLAEAKRTLIYGSARMHGCVISGESVVAQWSSTQGKPTRSDWQELQPGVVEEWEAFAQWYQSM